MSSQGTAAVAVAPILIPIGLAAALGLAGILVVQSGAAFVMWCGEKLDENYRNACASYSEEELRQVARVRARPGDRRAALLNAVMRNTAAASLGGAAGASAHDAAALAAITRAAAALRQTMDNLPDVEALKRDAEVRLWSQRLEAAVQGGEAVLPRTVLDAVRQAQNGDAAAMQAAYEEVQAAWQAVRDKQAHATDIRAQAREELDANARGQASVLLAQAREKLAAAALLLQQAGLGADAQREDDRARVEESLGRARSRLDDDPQLGLRLAREAMESAERLADGISHEVLELWDARRDLTAELNGQVAALRTIVRQGRVSELLPPDAAARCDELIEGFDAAVQAAVTGGPGATSLDALREQANLVKMAVFNAVGGQQKGRIASGVADTLRELGYEPEPTKEVGDEVQVKAVRRSPDPQVADQIVTFSLAPDGTLDYHLDGFAGAACVQEADRIFRRLRDKGIVVVAPDRSLAGISDPEQLKALDYAPEPVITHDPALLYEVMRKALLEMGATHIEERNTPAYSELDASWGGLGFTYDVRVTPTGQVQVLHDGRDDPDDPRVQELQRRASQAPRAPKRSRPTTKPRWDPSSVREPQSEGPVAQAE